MASAITTCPQCKSRNFKDIKTEETSFSELEKRTAKCSDCGKEFTYTTFSKIGETKRHMGRIW